MNLNKKISTEGEFNALYTVVYREFQKIANSSLCNALSAYDNIFVISISEGGYNEKLYWLIGDFLFACAKERRKYIFRETDWFQEYCAEFENFSRILDSINALCSFLNEILTKNCKGRKIDDFGYLLWERCVIQQIERCKGTTLGEEMLRQIEGNYDYFKSALLSLKNVIPNQEEPLYFYKVIYEDNALKYLKEKYTNKIIYKSFDDLIEQIEKIFTYEKNRMHLVFLEESFLDILKILEVILIGNNHSFIYTSLYQCLKMDPNGISKYFNKLAPHSNDFMWCCKEVIRSYVRSNFASDIKELHVGEKEHSVFFDLFYDKVQHAKIIIDSCFPGENLCDDIFTEKCNELKSPEFNERLVMYSGIVMDSLEYNEKRIILHQSLRFISDKGKFSMFYFAALNEKLLDYRHNYVREVSFIEFLKPYVEPHFYRKYVKMVKDIELSLDLNDVLRGKADSNIRYILNNYNCFVTVLNYSAWSLEDKNLDKTIILPSSFEEYRSFVNKEYIKAHPNRVLIWVWEEGYVDVSIMTDKKYSFRFNIYQYVVFDVIQGNNGVSLQFISTVTKLKEEEAIGIVDILVEHHLVLLNDNLYHLNDVFFNTETTFSIEKQSHAKKFKNEKLLDLKLYYKAKMIRILKRVKKLELKDLEFLIVNDHILEHEFNPDDYVAVLKELVNNGYIETNETSVFYEA